MGKYQIIIELPDTLNRCLSCPIQGITGRCRLQPNLKTWGESWHIYDFAKTCPLQKIEDAEEV